MNLRSVSLQSKLWFEHRWTALSSRERKLVATAFGLLVTAVFWSVAVAPAWRSLQQGPTHIQTLQQQLARMQQLSTQAAELKRMPALSVAGAGRGLDEASAQKLKQILGEGAQVQLQTNGLSLSFTDISASQLREALALVRSRVQAQVTQAELKPAEAGLKGRVMLQWSAAP